jgi:hypothetical protein
VLVYGLGGILPNSVNRLWAQSNSAGLLDDHDDHLSLLTADSLDLLKLAERKTEPQKESKSSRYKASLVTERDSGDGDEVLSIGPPGSWITDSGATSHLCTT